jgi:hypothetical protein
MNEKPTHDEIEKEVWTLAAAKIEAIEWATAFAIAILLYNLTKEMTYTEITNIAAQAIPF